jgi:hypothetical protein
MLISAPFDDWWHTAYGLDVRILSPPHVVLTLGILAVAAGAVLTIVAARNRASDGARRTLDLVVLAVAGEILVLGMATILERTFRSNLHAGSAYVATAIVAPLLIFSFATVSGRRWAATAIASAYTAFMAVMLWLVPLVPAEAKLGPVYQPITHFIPLAFPILVVVPAFACDLLLTRTRARGWPRLARALAAGPVFVAVLVAVEWPFADFLMMAHAKTWLFGAHHLPYFMRPEWLMARDEFLPDPALATGLAGAVGAAIVATYLGMAAGDALRAVKR